MCMQGTTHHENRADVTRIGLKWREPPRRGAFKDRKQRLKARTLRAYRNAKSDTARLRWICTAEYRLARPRMQGHTFATRVQRSGGSGSSAVSSRHKVVK